MLKEKRQILFDYKKVFEALNTQRENHGDTLIPESQIVDVSRKPDDDEFVIISLRHPNYEKTQKVKMSEDLFIKGLCLFCVKHDIMFPQSGKKSITLKKGKVILNILINGTK